MIDMIEIIKQRHSTRGRFDPDRRVPEHELKMIIEAARWAPTAHNMQNFEIIIIDDKELIETIGRIEFVIAEEFIRENFAYLSMSEEELKRKKVGILGTQFPRKWTDATKLDEAVEERTPSALSQTIRGGNTILLIIYDARKRAPASQGDFLGHLSLGCVMENIWLMAEALGVSVRIMSAFSAEGIQGELKKIIRIPDHMAFGFACKLGYPLSHATRYVRVRRELGSFTHHNQYGIAKVFE